MTSSMRAQAGELYDAAKSGDIVKARQLLQQGADVNAKDQFLRTPLHVAASEGNAEVAKLLIEKGADVNARDESWKPRCTWLPTVEIPTWRSFLQRRAQT